MATAARITNRNEALLDSAAGLFATRGYEAATMREIAKASGMLPGSIYYHYAGKEALLVAVYAEGVRRLAARVEAARDAACDVGGGGDAAEAPWARLEAMLATHVEMIVAPTDYARVIIRILPDAAPAVAHELTALRDGYEAVFAAAIEELPIAPGVDRRLTRLLLIGAANHVQVWHRPGGAPPAEIARALLRMVRSGHGAPGEGGAA